MLKTSFYRASFCCNIVLEIINERMINMKKVEIYIWSFCPYCVRAKKVLDSENVEYIEYEISRDRKKLKELKEITGIGSVPQIFVDGSFVDGSFVGGCDDILELQQNGEFDKVFK